MVVTFVPDSNGGIVRARLGNRDFACYVDCPIGYSVRWYHMHWPTPGYIENFATEAEAREAILLWVQGLEIVPWDEHGNPELR